MPWRHTSRGEWRYSSTILDLDTSWKWVISFKHRPLFAREERPRYQLEIKKKLGPKSRSERCRIDKNLLLLPGTKPQPSIQKPLAILTSRQLQVIGKSSRLLKNNGWFLCNFKMLHQMPELEANEMRGNLCRNWRGFVRKRVPPEHKSVALPFTLNDDDLKYLVQLHLPMNSWENMQQM
jgi:hypothetical protein